MTKLTSIEELTFFFEALLGHREYTADRNYIQATEHFLICWLNGFVGDDSQCEYTKSEGDRYIQYMYDEFIDAFSYSGTLYRGMSLLKGTTLKTDYLTSFTSNLEIGADFAEPLNSKHESRLFKLEVEKAFDFSRFLQTIGEKSSSVDFEIVLLDRLFEEEKMYVFSLDDVEEIALEDVSF